MTYASEQAAHDGSVLGIKSQQCRLHQCKVQNPKVESTKRTAYTYDATHMLLARACACLTLINAPRLLVV